ncbi:MAG: transglutaminase-like domain-containing protein [Bacteroidales bacterium]|nr:transglutaminase-like domain-containing protein [Bacteroidales bacterium]
MKKRWNLLMALIACMLLIACNENHFINDAAYRQQVINDFEQRKEMAQGREKELFSVFDQSMTEEEREALEFLYAYMPYSDLADYDGAFFINQVRYSFKARDYFSWGKTIPEDIFRHFVLVYRVNNENLDTARMVIFNEIKDRIKGMSMYDAALEVNHWCHEKVTYRPSDGRTSSSLASIKTAYGRCGEESTFTVTALRAVGIPARQCYTPRWAHTDDNHAWVEVWVDGKWYFLGACEPDAALNMGWFAVPSTRCMMVHSNAFGKYKGDEEVNEATGLFSRVNMLPNYTNTKKIVIKVTDQAGKAIQNATVKFKLYNYAEYYPIATGTTDEQGITSLTTGFGDLLIWASKDDVYEYVKMDVRKQDSMTLILQKNAGKVYTEMLEMIPPTAQKHHAEVDPQKIALNNLRLQYEDSLRNAYLATFPKENQTKNMVNENLTQEQIWDFVKKSEGNYAEIIKFLNNNAQKREGLYLNEFLSALSEKDLRDVEASTLQQHLTLYDGSIPEDVYLKGIMPARIGLEMIRPWRTYLSEQLLPIFGDSLNVSVLMNWIKENIKVDKNGNYFNCPISPRGVFELRLSDARSRQIFFVAACRSLQIPAYLDNATNQLFVYENDAWNIVTFEAEKMQNATGKLMLTYEQNSDVKPQYWIHYTIAKFENGDFVTFDYENDPRVANFPVTLDLETGYYMLSTGNRYSDGTTLSQLEFFNITEGEVVTKSITLRTLIPRDEFYGTMNIDDTLTIDGKEVKISDCIKDKQLILCFIDPNREPTKHTLKEMGQFKTQYETWGGNLFFVIPSDKNNTPFDAKKWNLPKQSQVIIDENAEWMNSILNSTNQEFRDNYPLIFIVNTDGGLIFKTEGYRIGTGELIYKSLQK